LNTLEPSGTVISSISPSALISNTKDIRQQHTQADNEALLPHQKLCV
jgi:hypothetical protein